MANKKGLAVLLSAAALLAAPVLASAQGAQPAGYMGPDQTVAQPASAQAPAENTDVAPPAENAAPPSGEQPETVKISAPRYRRIHEARIPGSPNRGNPMRQFPGELPEKNVYGTPFDLEGIVVEDARESQALPTIQGRPATPDTLNP